MDSYTNRARLADHTERAFSVNEKRLVVLKRASEGGKEVLRREALAYQVAGEAEGLVRCYGFDEQEEALVLEWLSGKTLGQLRSEGFFVKKEAELTELGVRLCKTIQQLHARGVIHRDISPNNVIISAQGPRLFDLGLALVESPAGHIEPFVGGRIGTAGYTAPEISEEYPGDARSDIFSLGALLRGLARDPRDAPGVVRISSRLEGILGQAASRSPKDRFKSAEALGSALRSHLRTLRVKQTVSSKPFVLVAGLAGLLAGIANLSRAHSQAPPSPDLSEQTESQDQPSEALLPEHKSLPSREFVSESPELGSVITLVPSTPIQPVAPKQDDELLPSSSATTKPKAPARPSAGSNGFGDYPKPRFRPVPSSPPPEIRVEKK